MVYSFTLRVVKQVIFAHVIIVLENTNNISLHTYDYTWIIFVDYFLDGRLSWGSDTLTLATRVSSSYILYKPIVLTMPMVTKHCWSLASKATCRWTTWLVSWKILKVPSATTWTINQAQGKPLVPSFAMPLPERKSWNCSFLSNKKLRNYWQKRMKKIKNYWQQLMSSRASSMGPKFIASLPKISNGIEADEGERKKSRRTFRSCRANGPKL